jgi:predicted NodU family carbamoyl transferase
LGNGAEIKRLDQVDFPDSLGLFYSAITGYLGFEVNEGEYKVMGLAPYGQPKYLKEIGQLIETGPGGEYRPNLKYYSFPTRRQNGTSASVLARMRGNNATRRRLPDAPRPHHGL